MTTHYSAPELERLVAAAELVCDRDGARPELVIMRGARRIAPTQSPQGEIRGQLKSVQAVARYGSACWARTSDPLINSQLLYQLS
jgi:hypothetical protein